MSMIAAIPAVIFAALAAALLINRDSDVLSLDSAAPRGSSSPTSLAAKLNEWAFGQGVPLVSTLNGLN